MNLTTFKTNRRGLGLVLILMIFGLLLSLGAGEAQARKDKEPRGGYSGPGSMEQMEPGGYTGPGPALVSVKQALEMRDDSWVSLRGNITRYVGGKHYEFRDASGVTVVKIGGKAWRGQQVGADDLVELQGKVDKDFNKTEIDVKRVIKQ